MRLKTICRLAVVSALAVAGAGCGKEVPDDQQVSGTTLCINYYALCVDPILHTPLSSANVSCSGQGLGCHSRQDAPDGSTISEGVGGRFKVNPAPISVAGDDIQMIKNYISAKNMSTAGSSSLLLTKPLAGTVEHGGGDLFPDTGDSNYARILRWISNAKDNQGNIDPALDTTECKSLFQIAPATRGGAFTC